MHIILIKSKDRVYLGRSLIHNRNVLLILNLNIGLLNHQFHVIHDPSFDVVNQQSFQSHWQAKAGFLKGEESKETDNKSNIHIAKNNESIIKPQSQKKQKVISEKRYVTLHNLKRNKRAK